MQRIPSHPIIDMHIHLGAMMSNKDSLPYDTMAQKSRLEDSGINKAVALALAWGDDYRRLRDKLSVAGEYFEVFPSVDIYQVEEPGFDAMVYQTFREYNKDGIKGLKMWKDITSKLRDKNGNVIWTDSPLFTPIWEYAAEFSLPIVFHHGAQPAYFDPPTPDNPFYESMIEHPMWNFYQPGMPSFLEHLEMQESMIAKNPKTKFVMAHVTGDVDNLARVSVQLDRYPNMYVDISARVGQLARQHENARDFLIKYSDRVMFGTDYSYSIEDVGAFYERHYQFLETDEIIESPFDDYSEDTLRGVNLPADVLEKLYYSNSIRIFGLSM